MKRNGEITSQQIVILVIVIVSFAVILFFLFRLNLGETTDEELCHNSVLTRGGAVVATEAVPLNCHRQYICLTAKGGTCEGLTNPKRIEVSTLDEVYGKLADQMANCWWMFGEGRVNYVGDDFVSNNYCSICSQIYFDKSLESITGKIIDKEKLYDYLEKTKIDKTNTYLQYLSGTDKKETIKKSLDEKGTSKNFGVIELGKQYFVMMGISSEVGVHWKVLQGVGIAVAGASFFTPAGWITYAVFAAGIATTGGAVVGEQVYADETAEILAFTIDGRGIDNYFLVPTIIEANSEKFDALNCEEILTLA